ncbi:hypothetical protein [Vulcanisaeta sp. JCM 14467]|uniref:hypothetical protein n=1 Tax=Vulcanisaeta sp. JCM 14467 TaxID=1295370 RepID=UPI000AFC3696|nr:hypothetical protein [Vulcanisaeta sp. JCM 14467]
MINAPPSVLEVLIKRGVASLLDEDRLVVRRFLRGFGLRIGLRVSCVSCPGISM